MQTKAEKKPGALAVVSGTLAREDVSVAFPKALDRVVNSVELPGFRKGKAPKDRVLEEVGEKGIWRDAAEEVLKDQLAEILAEHKVLPIIPPTISLEVSAAHVDVPFTVTVTTQPTLTLENYKKVADGALEKLEKLDAEKEKGEARKSLDGQVKAMLQKTDDSPATDDDAKKVGFENAKALEHFLDTEADRAVENYDSQRRRGAVAEALLAASTYDIPAVIVQDEARAMLESTKAEIARTMPFNEYLQKRGITEEVLVGELQPQAEKRVALDMVFAKIASEEKLKPDDAETHRVAHALMHQGAPEDRAHSYAAEMSVREQIWTYLGIAAPAKPLEKEAPAHNHSHEGHDHSDPNHTH